jgi:hypothetical protein
MSSISTDCDRSPPPEGIFNRFFVEYPEWKIRECYLGRQEPAELVGALASEVATFLAETRDQINLEYEPTSPRYWRMAFIRSYILITLRSRARPARAKKCPALTRSPFSVTVRILSV